MHDNLIEVIEITIVVFAMVGFIWFILALPTLFKVLWSCVKDFRVKVKVDKSFKDYLNTLDNVRCKHIVDALTCAVDSLDKDILTPSSQLRRPDLLEKVKFLRENLKIASKNYFNRN